MLNKLKKFLGLKPKLEIDKSLYLRNESSFVLHSGRPLEAFQQHQDIIDGLFFSATLQLRTPLRVLTKHGEIHTNPNKAPPKYAKELWEGIWIVKAKSWRELGFDMDELPEGTMASHIGQVKAAEYLPFLITIHEIVESDDSIGDRMDKLRVALANNQWASFTTAHDGADKILNYFFPKFIETIPKLNDETVKKLSELKIETPNKIAGTPDDVLLNINGIGKAKLNTIREYCAGISKYRDSIWLDKVSR